jgi:hypothetical protein
LFFTISKQFNLTKITYLYYFRIFESGGWFTVLILNADKSYFLLMRKVCGIRENSYFLKLWMQKFCFIDYFLLQRWIGGSKTLKNEYKSDAFKKDGWVENNEISCGRHMNLFHKQWFHWKKFEKNFHFWFHWKKIENNFQKNIWHPPRL